MGVDFRQLLVLVGGRDGGVVTKSARELVCLGMGRARHPKPHTPLLWTERVVVANGLGREEGRNKVNAFRGGFRHRGA